MPAFLLPEVFLRLAQDSGIIAGRLYLSEGDPPEELNATLGAFYDELQTTGTWTNGTFIRTWLGDVEPAVPDVVGGVEVLLAERSHCISAKKGMRCFG